MFHLCKLCLAQAPVTAPRLKLTWAFPLFSIQDSPSKRVKEWHDNYKPEEGRIQHLVE